MYNIYIFGMKTSFYCLWFCFPFPLSNKRSVFTVHCSSFLLLSFFWFHFIITVSFIDNHVVMRKLFIFIVIASLVAHTVAHRNIALHWLRAELPSTLKCPQSNILVLRLLIIDLFIRWTFFVSNCAWLHHVKYDLEYDKAHTCDSATNRLADSNLIHFMILFVNCIQIQSNRLNQWNDIV